MNQQIFVCTCNSSSPSWGTFGGVAASIPFALSSKQLLIAHSATSRGSCFLVNGAAIKTRPILPACLTTVKMSSGYLEQPKLQAISGCQHGTIWCDLRLLLFRRDIDRLVVPEHSSEARRSCWQKLLAKVTAHDLVRTFSSSQLRSNIMGAVQHNLSEPVHQSLFRGKSALRKGLVVRQGVRVLKMQVLKRRMTGIGSRTLGDLAIRPVPFALRPPFVPQ